MLFIKGLILTIAITSLTISPQTTAESGSDFIRVTDFIAANPTPKKIMQSFGAVVRNDPIPSTSSERVKIAVIYPGVQSSDYWRRSIKAFTSRLDKLKLTYEIKTYLSRPGVDRTLQAEQLAEAVGWQPDYLIFSADALHHRNAIQRILLKGKPKLILQNITTPHKAWLKHPPFLYTGFDHELGTQKLSEEMLNNQVKKYALLYFSPGYVSQMRGDTFVRQARRMNHLEEVASFYTDGNRDKARAATKKILQTHPDIEMIFACSTDIALGAIDELESQNKQDAVVLNGWGGGAAEIEQLLKGKLDLTVMRINDDASVAMAEAIKLDIEGKTDHVPKIYSGDIVLLNQNTTLEEINSYKEKAFRYSDL